MKFAIIRSEICPPIYKGKIYMLIEVYKNMDIVPLFDALEKLSQRYQHHLPSPYAVNQKFLLRHIS